MAIEVDVDDNGTIDIEYGGTNATTPAGARTNLGLGTAAVLDASNSDGDVVVIQTGQKLPILDGSNLTNVQPVGGGVTSVNGEVGDVVLDADDIQDGVNYVIITKAEQANIANNTLIMSKIEDTEENADRAEAAAIAAEASEDAAALSETGAASSATAAASSESSASLDAASATTSEGNAAASAASASTSETNAAISEANAATSETNAANSEAAATLSEINAGTSEDNALISENKAHLWAEETVDVEVEAGEYSAHHWAIKAGENAASNLAADITVSAAGFDGNLSPTDSDVQTALQTIDDLLLSDPVRTATRTEADFTALADANRDKFSGSGFVEFGKHDFNETNNIAEGLWTTPSIANVIAIGESGGTSAGVSKTMHPICNINGCMQSIVSVDEGTVFGQSTVHFPPAPTVPTMTERQDLLFLESWHEKINDKNIVYPYGNIQSLLAADTATGLTTVAGSFTGFETYSLFGNWQASSDLIGLGLVWDTMSDTDKKKFVSDPENNVYLAEDGELVQVRYRIRVVEGLGVDYDITDASAYSQGSNVAITTNNFTLNDLDKGLYNSVDSEAIEIALVSRRNQGAFHPVWNPNGTRSFWSTTVGNIAPWFNSALGGLINSTMDCFTFDNVSPTIIGQVAGANYSGNIVSTDATGRPDNKFYDAIYESDVLDLRNSAHKQDLTRTLEREFNKLVAGEIRGWEETPQTTTDGTVGGTASVAAHNPNRELLWCDLVGDPANYPQQWKDNGVAGNALLVGEEGEDLIPDGTQKNFKMSRKVKESLLTIYSTDNGATWTATSTWHPHIEGPTNSRVNTIGTGYVYMFFYLTDAHATEVADNAEVLKLGDVWAGNHNNVDTGALIVSSLINKVPVGSGYGQVPVKFSLDGYTLSDETGARQPNHDNTVVKRESTHDPAAKVLPYLTRENGKLYLQALFKEMKYDTDWGDDNKFDVVSGVSTTADDNGNTVLIGQKRIELPFFIGDVE